MLALIIGIVTIAASFGAAWLGAWLQRNWTPDPRPDIRAVEARVNELRRPIENVEGRVQELRQRVDEIEQDRVEGEGFTLGVRLRQADIMNWIIEVKNDTSQDVYVETIQFFRDGTPLSGIDKPKNPTDWLIQAQRQQQISWPPQENPVMALNFTAVGQHNHTLPYEFVLGCRTNGKRRTARAIVSLTFSNGRLTQFP